MSIQTSASIAGNSHPRLATPTSVSRLNASNGLPMPPGSDHLSGETNQLTVETLLEVARLDDSHRRQAQLALEVLSTESAIVSNPDLDQVQLAGISEPQRSLVTCVMRRLLAAQRVLGGRGTIMLIRRAAAEKPDDREQLQTGNQQDLVDAIVYTGERPGGLKRILLYSLETMSWRVTHLSVYVLPKLHSHFANGILFETPSLRYPLLPFTDAFDAKTRLRVASKWTSDKLSDRLVAIQKLGQLMPALYFGVVDQFLRGSAVGTVDKAFQFAITVPAVAFDPKTLVHLPFLRERRFYR